MVGEPLRDDAAGDTGRLRAGRDRHFGWFTAVHAAVGARRGPPVAAQPIVFGAQRSVLGLQRPRAALEGGQGLASVSIAIAWRGHCACNPSGARGEPESADEPVFGRSPTPSGRTS